MQVCLNEGLGAAFEISKNLLQKEELTQVQERNLEMALSLIIISKRFFDYITNRKDLEVLKNWPANCQDIRKYYLAKKPDGKNYLYASYLDIPDKDIGIWISPDDLQDIQQLSDQGIAAYWKNILQALGYSTDKSNIVQMSMNFN